MGEISDTRKLLMLLNLVSTSQEQLTEMAKFEIKQTDAYQIITSLEQYYFLSEKAIDLKNDLSRIHFENKSLEEIYIEYDRLRELVDTGFYPFLRESNANVKKQIYHLDILEKKTLLDLQNREPNNRYTKFLDIITKSSSLDPISAFRKYLKVKQDDDVYSEYLHRRNDEMRIMDRKRQNSFRIIGTAVGFMALPFLLQHFLFNNTILLIIAAIFAIIFLYGFFRKNVFARFFTSGSTIIAFIGLFLLTLLESIGKLTQNVSTKTILETACLLGIACIGGFLGMMAGNRLNFLPKLKFRNPKILSLFHKYTLVLITFFTLFGYAWINAYSNQQNIATFTSEIIQQRISAAEAKRRVENAESASKTGVIEVIADTANVRYEPSLNGEVAYVVNKGSQFDYFDIVEDPDEPEKRSWYKIKFTETNEDVWISVNTLTVIE